MPIEPDDGGDGMERPEPVPPSRSPRELDGDRAPVSGGTGAIAPPPRPEPRSGRPTGASPRRRDDGPEGDTPGRPEPDRPTSGHPGSGDDGDDHHTPLTQQVGRVALVVIAGLFVAFAVVNAQHVDFSWLFGETRVVESGGTRTGGGVRLIVLLGAAFVAGALVGALGVRSRAHARQRRED